MISETDMVDILHGRPGLGPALTRAAMAPLALLYQAGLECYLALYSIGLRKTMRLPCTVISVGNISAGGTGKTPMTQTLCRELSARGYRVAVLNRGYRGGNEYGVAVVSDFDKVLLSASEAGDEAFLLATSLPGIPVIVGKDRRLTGKEAITRFHPEVLILDDGMQYWQLHRDLDIALVNASCPFDNGWVFPRGLLREPPAHLRRAGVVVVTGAERAGAASLENSRQRVARLAPQSRLFEANLVPTGLHPLCGGEPLPISWLEGRVVAAACGIGDPDSYLRMLESLGATVCAKTTVGDHGVLSADQWQELGQTAHRQSAEAVVITEKDAVKATDVRLSLPLYAVTVAMQTDDDAALVELVEEKIHARRDR